MTTDALRHAALHTAQSLVLAPILFAALIGCIPVLIPCIACRCCRELLARMRASIAH